jgi:hypothetical protein
VSAEVEGNVSAEVDEIFVELAEEIRELLERDPIDRKIYAIALANIGVFLKPFIGLKAATRLLFLGQMLTDLDQGAAPEILSPGPVKSRRPDASSIWVARAFATAALQALIEAGEDEKPASERLARNQKFTAKKLRNWLGEFQGRRIKNMLAMQIFDRHRSWFKSMPPAELREYASIAIREAEGTE